MMEDADTPQKPIAVQKLYERSSGDFLISTDPEKLQIACVCDFLARSYWANTRQRSVTERSLENSLCFGVYMRHGLQSAPLGASGLSPGLSDQTGPTDRTDQTDRTDSLSQSSAAESTALRQVGFVRLVTDYATFAWLCDVFVAEEFRGRGLGKWLVETAVAHPELRGLRRWMLATADAHELYRQFGFVDLSAPERWMERFAP